MMFDGRERRWRTKEFAQVTMIADALSRHASHRRACISGLKYLDLRFEFLTSGPRGIVMGASTHPVDGGKARIVCKRICNDS
jgi:hypothetical protein